MTVENLEINVKTNAGDAADNVRSLRDALKGVRSAAGKATGVSNGVKQIGQEAKKATKHTNKLWSSIKRISMYRMLRTAIKDISQAFSEGLQAAYAFSVGINTEGHRFAESLDRMKSVSNQMKGQLGSAFAGLLAALEPIIVRIADLITKLADIISQFFSAFTGSTYLRAVRTQAQFANVTAQGARAAKEWKNQLLGFDEINKLNAPSDTSSSNSQNALEGYAFEDSPISENIRRIVEKIKGFIESVKAKIADLKNSIDFSKLKESLGRLGESFSNLWGTLKKGFGWVWEHILEPLAEWTIEELAPALVNALAAAFDFLDAVLETLAPVLEPLWEDVLEPFFEWCGDLVITGLEELTDLLKDLTALIRGDISWNDFVDGLDAVKVAFLALGSVAVISAIVNVSSKIASIPGTIMTAVAGSKIASALLIAVIAGAVYTIVEKVEKLKEALAGFKEAAKTHQSETANAFNTYNSLFIEKGKQAADEWAYMVYQIDTSGDDFATAQKRIAEKIETYWEGVPESVGDAIEDVLGITHKKELTSPFDFPENSVFNPNIESIKKSYSEIPQSMADGLEKGFSVSGFDKIGNQISGYFQDSINDTKNVLDIHSPSGVFKEIGMNTAKGFWNGFLETWNQFVSDFGRHLANFRDYVQKNLNIGSVSVSVQSYQPRVSKSGQLSMYANGGLPNVGELFIANERGPELVGKLNGHNAVGNNEQIEAGIEEAAYRGFVRAIASSDNNRGGDVVLNINGREFARATYNDYRAAAKERGSSLINNFA